MGAFALPASAQCEAKNDAFQSGEHVMYDLYFNWKFVWVKAGLASLTTNATAYHSQPAYRINLLALGSKRADFFFKMRDTLTCVIGEKLEPRYFRKGAEEGKRYTVDEAWFSYKDGLCLVNQKRTYRDGAFNESEDSDSRCIYDMCAFWRKRVLTTLQIIRWEIRLSSLWLQAAKWKNRRLFIAVKKM